MTDDTITVDRPRPGGTAELAGRQVARVGFGAMQLERLRDDRPAAVALVRRAIELGVDHFDTAEFYGGGFSNRVLQEALGRSGDAIVVSKVGAEPNPGGAIPLRSAQRPAMPDGSTTACNDSWHAASTVTATSCAMSPGWVRLQKVSTSARAITPAKRNSKRVVSSPCSKS